MFNNANSYNVNRLRLYFALVGLIFGVFLIRLFYLQIIRHNYYSQAALASQLKEYEVKAERGTIEVHDHGKVIPLVLNEKLYTLFADPKFITDPKDVSNKVAGIIGGNATEYEAKMKVESRYSILAKKLSSEQRTKLDELKIKGIGTREELYRTYPQGSLAAQLLGFVNDEGKGSYGIEQYFDSELKGSPGQLKAITDASGVPLVSNKDNVVVEPKTGKKLVLTIDLSMQRQLEETLRSGLENARSDSGSALIIDPNTGAIKAMANLPTYNPAEFYKVEDANLFTNGAVSAPLEIGSSMKPLTVAAGLDKGVIAPETTYFDQGYYVIDGFKITNIEEHSGSGSRSIGDVLQMSLNTGAVHVLKQFGGGELNEKGRVVWHQYLTNHYRFGKLTGIEQGYESEGSVPDPKEGFGLNLQYANTSFGQGLSITPLQMAAAFSSTVNGGTYYRPRLIDYLVDEQGNKEERKPEILNSAAVKPETSRQIRGLLEYAFSKNYLVYGMKSLRSEYSIGGKTGTAQIAKPGGGYYEDRYNGTFVGYVGGDSPEYVIFVRVNEPKIGGYAGAKAAAPIFSSTVDMLINNFGVTPKSH